MPRHVKHTKRFDPSAAPAARTTSASRPGSSRTPTPPPAAPWPGPATSPACRNRSALPARRDRATRHRHLASRRSVGERGCHVTTYRRLRHRDAVVIAQPLRDRGHRHRRRQLLLDPPVMHRDQRPGHRPGRRVDQLREPAPDPLPPHLLLERPSGRVQTLGQRRCEILRIVLRSMLSASLICTWDRPAFQCRNNSTKSVTFHDLLATSGPFQDPRVGAPERSEPEQHPNPRRTRPKGGELRDGGWGIT